jgi:hypothetical protein
MSTAAITSWDFETSSQLSVVSSQLPFVGVAGIRPAEQKFELSSPPVIFEIRSAQGMPFAEPETALASRVRDSVTLKVNRRKKIAPGAFYGRSGRSCITLRYCINDLQKVSTTYKLFQQLAPILNDLRASAPPLCPA